jgi:hypothetical protein
MSDTHRNAPPATLDNPSGKSAPNYGVVLLEELLRLTFAVRDLYASARYQGADIDVRQLPPLFDTHLAAQLRLAEILVDRICALHAARGALAPTFPQATHQTAYVLRGLAPERLLCDLLDAHARVLDAADTAGANDLQTETSADRDFAVGRVVLSNDLQRHAVREQLAVLQM